MKIKMTLVNSSYRKQLLKLSRLYGIKEIRNKILRTRITNKQIESLLKKNNISLPKEVIDRERTFLDWSNLSKVLVIIIILTGIFGTIPLFEKNSNTIMASKKNIKSQIEKLNRNFYKNENIVLNDDFIFEDDLEVEEEKENTIRLGAATLNEIFKSANYDLSLIRKTKKVKPIYISILPSEMNKIENVKEKKEIFIKIILPLILAENEKIISDRKKLFRILGKIQNNKSEKKWLKVKLKEYQIKNFDLSELKIRMDIIPVSLAIAQAAKETGWGISRFAQQGNALFGQWTYSEKGLVPLNQISGDHKVMKFNVLQASVRAYKRNLNSHRSYSRFRKARAELREKREKIDSLKLVKYLDKYAETGKQYTVIIEKIIKQNHLMDFDQAKLLPTKSIINGNT